MGHTRPLFLYFRLSTTQLTDNKCSIETNKFLPMTGFEPRTSSIGSNRSTNWATTTAQPRPLPFLSQVCKGRDRNKDFRWHMSFHPFWPLSDLLCMRSFHWQKVVCQTDGHFWLAIKSRNEKLKLELEEI